MILDELYRGRCAAHGGDNNTALVIKGIAGYGLNFFCNTNHCGSKDIKDALKNADYSESHTYNYLSPEYKIVSKKIRYDYKYNRNKQFSVREDKAYNGESFYAFARKEDVKPIDSYDEVVITEGEKDCDILNALFAQNNKNIIAVTCGGCTQTIPTRMRFIISQAKRIRFIGDGDKPGIECAKRWEEAGVNAFVVNEADYDLAILIARYGLDFTKFLAPANGVGKPTASVGEDDDITLYLDSTNKRHVDIVSLADEMVSRQLVKYYCGVLYYRIGNMYVSDATLRRRPFEEVTGVALDTSFMNEVESYIISHTSNKGKYMKIVSKPDGFFDRNGKVVTFNGDVVEYKDSMFVISESKGAVKDELSDKFFNLWLKVFCNNDYNRMLCMSVFLSELLSKSRKKIYDFYDPSHDGGKNFTMSHIAQVVPSAGPVSVENNFALSEVVNNGTRICWIDEVKLNGGSFEYIKEVCKKLANTDGEITIECKGRDTVSIDAAQLLLILTHNEPLPASKVDTAFTSRVWAIRTDASYVPGLIPKEQIDYCTSQEFLDDLLTYICFCTKNKDRLLTVDNLDTADISDGIDAVSFVKNAVILNTEVGATTLDIYRDARDYLDGWGDPGTLDGQRSVISILRKLGCKFVAATSGYSGRRSNTYEVTYIPDEVRDKQAKLEEEPGSVTKEVIGYNPVEMFNEFITGGEITTNKIAESSGYNPAVPESNGGLHTKTFGTFEDVFEVDFTNFYPYIATQLGIRDFAPEVIKVKELRAKGEEDRAKTIKLNMNAAIGNLANDNREQYDQIIRRSHEIIRELLSVSNKYIAVNTDAIFFDIEEKNNQKLRDLYQTYCIPFTIETYDKVIFANINRYDAFRNGKKVKSKGSNK